MGRSKPENGGRLVTRIRIRDINVLTDVLKERATETWD